MKLQSIAQLGLCMCIAVLVRAEIDTPQVGTVRNANGTVHALYGIHANFVHGRQISSFVGSASFSSQAGLIERRGVIELLSAAGNIVATYPTGEADTLVSIEGDALSAIAWLPRQRILITWDGSQFQTTAVSQDPGSVSCVRKIAATAELLATAADGTVTRQTIDLSSGTIIKTEVLPGVQGRAFEHQSYLLFHDADGLEVQASDGSRRTIAIAAADVRMERMSANWLHISSITSRRDWALHFDTNTLELSELPVPPNPRQRRPVHATQEVTR